MCRYCTLKRECMADINKLTRIRFNNITKSVLATDELCKQIAPYTINAFETDNNDRLCRLMDMMFNNIKSILESEKRKHKEVIQDVDELRVNYGRLATEEHNRIRKTR
jgi:hypothetical protein